MERVVFEVVEIRGKCSVHRLGDKITIEGARIVLEETDALCIHALSSLLHYAVALREGISPVKLGLSKDEGVAYIQCLDPGEPYTSGGTVVFMAKRERK